jgi:hypothetical protein
VRYFVIMGNTRVGSTWFSAAMNAVPGVFCTREIRWRLPYMDEPLRVHTYVDRTSNSIKERLDFGLRASKRKRDIAVVGAKLKFDPHGYAVPSAFADLGDIIEEDVHIVFLRRRYFEIFTTLKAFGIRHLANPNTRRRAKRSKDGETEKEQQPNRFHSMHSAPLKQKRVYITPEGSVIMRLLRNRVGAGQVVYCSAGEAIDDLLLLFYNDVLGLTAVAKHRSVDIFYYQDIRSRFFSVTKELGLGLSEDECLRVLDSAPTRQIEPPDAKLVFPEAGLQAVSDCLDSTFNKIRSGELALREVLCADEANGSIVFHLPEFAAILERHQETRALLRPARPRSMSFLRNVLACRGRVEGRYPPRFNVLRRLIAETRLNNELWIAQRHMYVPMPVISSPATVTSEKPAAT